LTTQSVAAAELPITAVYADRKVSTNSANFIHGIEPLITELIEQGEDREQAYIARETIAGATGAPAGHLLATTYPKQLAEAGIVRMASRGEFGMHRRKDGTLRGKACGWALDWDSYTPGDLPVLDLVTDPYFIDIDHTAIAGAMSPVADTWAEHSQAHHLVMALLHHAGLCRVQLTPDLAAEILGKSRVTGWRALRDLVELGLASKEVGRPTDGGGRLPDTYWVDVSALFYDASLVRVHPEVEQRRQDAHLLRESVFTLPGWGVRSVARIARETLAMLRGLSGALRPVVSRYTAAVGRSLRSAVLHHMREREGEDSGTGLEDFKIQG
jgi:hypothetical protein